MITFSNSIINESNDQKKKNFVRSRKILRQKGGGKTTIFLNFKLVRLLERCLVLRKEEEGKKGNKIFHVFFSLFNIRFAKVHLGYRSMV